MVMETQRTFIPGDEWCYFKLYTGFKTADAILMDCIMPLAKSLTDHQVVDKWFFIRYSDPKFHLRIRFHAVSPVNIPAIIMNFNHAVRHYVEDGLIWKVQADTYNRELERYGEKTMELSESYFYYDSDMIVKTLMFLKRHPDEDLQWLLGMKMIDRMLEDFGYTPDEKFALLNMMQEGFKKEFGIDGVYKRQFGQKYRSARKQIETILDKRNEQREDLATGFSPIFEKSNRTKDITAEIRAITQQQSTPSLDDLMRSYIHMTMNRLFRTQQRTHELVLYDLLFRYYTSQKAQMKNKQVAIDSV